MGRENTHFLRCISTSQQEDRLSFQKGIFLQQFPCDHEYYTTQWQSQEDKVAQTKNYWIIQVGSDLPTPSCSAANFKAKWGYPGPCAAEFWRSSKMAIPQPLWEPFSWRKVSPLCPISSAATHDDCLLSFHLWEEHLHCLLFLGSRKRELDLPFVFPT